jgi:iron complex outermembrane receptor protein
MFIRRMGGLLLATSVLGTTGWAVPALAQEPAAQASSGDIIVTARRVEERLQDVPISITVFSQAALNSRNITNVTELASYTPSLSVNNRYGAEKATFAIRGFVQDLGTAPSVGVYFADVVGPRSSGTTPGGNGVGVGNLFDLQNVQVLKGPQGTLFGRNTTGGAVLLVPNKPTDKFEGYVEGSLGNYNLKRVQAVLNVPLSDTFKVRLGVDRLKQDGYLKNHSDIGPKDFGNSDYIAARLSIVANITPDLENYMIFSYTDSDNNGIVPHVGKCISPTDPSQTGLQFLGAIYGCPQIARQTARGDNVWDVENDLANPRAHMNTWQTINTTTWQASDNLKIKNIASYSELRQDEAINLTGEYWFNADGSLFPPHFPIQGTDNYHNAAQSTFTEELQFQGKTGRLEWQAGGYYERSNPIGYSAQTVPFLNNCIDASKLNCLAGYMLQTPGGPLTLGAVTQSYFKQYFRSKGLYAQGTYTLTDKLSLTGGFRYTWDEQRSTQADVANIFVRDFTPITSCRNPRISGPGGPGTVLFITPSEFRKCSVEFEQKSSKPTWVIDAEYKPTTDMMVYAKWSRGYRAGGVNAQYVYYETWNPETVDTYELGGKTSFHGAVSGYFNLTGFYNNFRNQQLGANLVPKVGYPGTGITTVNAGKSRMWGVEVDSSFTFFNSLNIQAGYAYLNTKLLKVASFPDDNTPFVPGGSPWLRVVPYGVEGDPLPYSPKHKATISATYTLPLDRNIGEVSVGATYVWTSKQVVNTTTPYGILDSSSLLNLNATWKNVAKLPIDLAFYVTNVTNEQTITAPAGVWFVFGYESFIAAPPRMFGFRVKYKFGQ